MSGTKEGVGEKRVLGEEGFDFKVKNDIES